MKHLPNNIELTEADVEAVKSKLENINEIMPYLIGLSAKDRQVISVIGSKSIQFIENALNSMQRNPGIRPAFLDMDEAVRNYQLFSNLTKIQNAIRTLERMVTDTLMVAGSQTYSDSLVYYNSVKRAVRAGVPGAAAVQESLRKRFKYTKRKKAEKSTNSTGDSVKDTKKTFDGAGE
jgi:hypothetical protein